MLRQERESVGPDLGTANIEMFVVDRDGVLCPRAENRVVVSMDGPGRLLCLDNGDTMSDRVFEGAEVSVHAGRALAIVQSTGTEKALRIIATSPGLETGACTIDVVRSPGDIVALM